MDHSKNLEKILPAKNSLPDAGDCFLKENLKRASKTLLQVKAARIFAEAVEGEVSFFINYSDIARDHAFNHVEFC